MGAAFVCYMAIITCLTVNLTNLQIIPNNASVLLVVLILYSRHKEKNNTAN